MAQYAHATSNSSRKSASDSAIQANVLEHNLWKLVLLSGLAYLVWGEKLNIHFSFGKFSDAIELNEGNMVAKAAMLGSSSDKGGSKKAKKQRGVELPVSALNNLTFSIDPAFARRNGVTNAEVAARAAVVNEYVKRFAPIAVAEMRKYGVPASITLGQGLLESNAGGSQLARSANNHFGVKCFSKRCARGHCVNFTDDSHKDFFVKYPNAWSSFRAHSQFLRNSERYSRLFDLSPQDYQGWATGLTKAGYATDKRYAEKLAAIIQNLELDRFDRQ